MENIDIEQLKREYDQEFNPKPASLWSRLLRWFSGKGPVQKIGEPISVKVPEQFVEQIVETEIPMAKQVVSKSAPKSIAAKKGVSEGSAGTILESGARNTRSSASKAKPVSKKSKKGK